MLTPRNGPRGEEVMAEFYNVDDTAEPSDQLASFANPADLPVQSLGRHIEHRKISF